MQARYPAPSWRQVAVPGKASPEGLWWQKPGAWKACFPSSAFQQQRMGVSAHGQMTRVTSQSGSKQWPWEARKEELEAWNHAEVRDPDHVILTPIRGLRYMGGGTGVGWRSPQGLQKQPALPLTSQLCDLV